MAQSYKIGDVVKLKSGGPKMTVTYQLENNRYACDWFVGTENKTGTFPGDSLELAKEQESSGTRDLPPRVGQWS